MKVFQIVAVSLATLALIDVTSGFIVSPPVAPFFGIGGPFFPGLFGALGPFGLGGLGAFGPFGLGLGLGSFGGLGGFGIGRARLGGIRGRRSLSEIHNTTTGQEEIKCELSETIMNCVGPHEIIQCEISEIGSLDKSQFKIFDFQLEQKTENEATVLRFVPKKLSHRLAHKVKNWTIVEDASKVKEGDEGILIKEPTCFAEIVDLVKEFPEKIVVSFANTD